MWITQNKPIIALAPMADMTDSPFCRVCREVSGGDFVIFREMVSAEAIVRGNEKTLKMCGFDEIERPIVLQIFGGDPKIMREAAEIIVCANTPLCSPLRRGEILRPDGIDVNMGCPVPKIAGKSKAGAALMKDHERAVAIIKELKAANLGVPVSVKTRLGWSKDDEILEFAQKLEQAGADAITIHGRTKKQGYSGVANWDRIKEVKKLVSIPVIANGDIHSREDIARCLEITGADGVMIGRAALGNPWIFDMRNTKECEIAKIDVVKIVLRHAELHLEHYGEEFGLKTFRKHLLCYFRGFDGVKELRQRLVRVEKYEELGKELESL
ncbi:MAG: hypothetical protein A2921_04690 [Candidatus Magasanikbacteria bacterium RIFCSPLOWO2_01_FULL_43_20b]|uniref:tRNA-dihydrouridine synthase n=1 Tax=Candidatus Magasanikbacteria bacterium RIFCSPLOWO2_12_FULL_43_12 TaxID=1798692 RepID=A0A1F6MSB1_9BACT|nr:MAG: hypothetical protein A3C74_00420 [Candidatus Magasanikbacteria bacterium RIFCSPHIGHO2_02_FULL_44_13]OGH73082.1 MAG: hypothetical protein A2921_04690 [Candidatus Magasanikbacteria bacterium RIFCSPLOWO2_01_FULL_43_20b]OGH74420.1 MAG: hypothetical protein A3G00_01000 [Candidatus Magasanikbacteria bacterium RIFCSPLOWO2_12_FULL_43_12]